MMDRDSYSKGFDDGVAAERRRVLNIFKAATGSKDTPQTRKTLAYRVRHPKPLKGEK